MDFSEIKAIIFDFDGTLYDFKGLTKKLLLSIPFSLFKAKAERETRRFFKGKSFASKEEFQNSYFSFLASKTHTSPEKAKKWYDSVYMKAMVKTLKRNFRKREDADKILKTLKENGIKTAVFSDYGLVEKRLEAVGLSPSLFDLCTDAETMGGLKPAKTSFEKVAELLKTESENCLMVGDRSDTDGKGALSSGMKFIQIRTHKTPENEKNSPTGILSWEDFSSLILSSL